MKWFLRACPVCGGDLHEDIEDRGWVTCFLCARSFPVAQVQGAQDVGAPKPDLVKHGEPLRTAA
jgi:hypothetical protein